MSAAGIPLYAELILRRESWAASLAQATNDVQSWAQQIAGMTINLSVKPVLDTAELDRLIAGISSRVVTVPVQFVAPGGGQAIPVGGGFSGGTMPPAMPSQITQPTLSFPPAVRQASGDFVDDEIFETTGTAANGFNNLGPRSAFRGRSGQSLHGMYRALHMARLGAEGAGLIGAAGSAAYADTVADSQAAVASGQKLVNQTMFGEQIGSLGRGIYTIGSRFGNFAWGGGGANQPSRFQSDNEFLEQAQATGKLIDSGIDSSVKSLGEMHKFERSQNRGTDEARTANDRASLTSEYDRRQFAIEESRRKEAQYVRDANLDPASITIQGQNAIRARQGEFARERGLLSRDIGISDNREVQAQGYDLDVARATLGGDSDAVRRIRFSQSIASQQRAAREQGPGAEARFNNEMAPLLNAENERQIISRRTLQSAQSQDRIGDTAFSATNAMQRAGGDAYHADAAAFSKSIDDKVRRLRELADAEEDTAKKAQLNAEAEAEARAKVINVMARQIEHAHAIGLAAQQTDLGTAGMQMRASSDDLRAMGLDYAAHGQDHRAEMQSAAAASQVKLNELSRSGDTIGYAAEVRRGQAEQAGLASRERVYQYQRHREIRDLTSQADVADARYRRDGSGADLMEIENQNRRDVENAGGDPVKEAAARRIAADRVRAFAMDKERESRARPVSGTRDDAYHAALVGAFENPQTTREREAARISKERAIRKAWNDLHMGGILGPNLSAEALNEAAQKIKDKQQEENAKAFKDVVDKLGKAADKLNDLQLVGVIR